MNDLPSEMNRIARFFDAEYAEYEDDLPVLLALAQRTQAPLLELGCGTGRVLAPLAEAGFEIHGIDSSPAMLEIARRKVEAAGAGRRVRLIQGDFAKGLEKGRYRFAFALMNTFLHLQDQAGQLAALDAWHDALGPGGLLLIDIFSPDVAELAALNGRLEWDRTWTDPATGSQVMKLLARTVDPAEQLMQVSHIYDEIAADGTVRRSVASFELRYLWRFEAELLLEKAGFEVEELYGDWEMGDYDSSSDRMILIAKKKARRK
jgi:SAM-dependent methyltransferase